jgi:hypothetical protein
MVPAEEAGATSAAPVAGSGAATCGHCTAYAAPVQTGTVEPSELNALSGVAVSRSQPDIVFAHNDHGQAVVFALDLQGHLHARITLENATASDIEDIAVGPCGAQTCVVSRGRPRFRHLGRRHACADHADRVRALTPAFVLRQLSRAPFLHARENHPACE